MLPTRASLRTTARTVRRIASNLRNICPSLLCHRRRQNPKSGLLGVLERFFLRVVHPALQDGLRSLVDLQETHASAHIHLGIDDLPFALEKIFTRRNLH